jgi:oligopeptide/dipeptide ABC transporter ATP-binding protein
MSGARILQATGLERDYAVSRGMLKGSVVLQALRGASFALHEGRTLAVVGESGCGKSTLARLVTLVEPPSAGKLEIDGIDVAHASHDERKQLRRTVQIVFQDPYGSLNPRKKVGAILEEPVRINTGMAAAERQSLAQDMMSRVGLRPEHYGRYPHMFSGGQRQRIAVARALMLKPRIVVLDEPVSALDVSIRAGVINLLADLQRELGLSYQFVSHDLSVVRHVADRVAVMYLGRIVELAPTDALFTRAAHPYTQALISAIPVPDPRKERTRRRIILAGDVPSPVDPPSGCRFRTRCFKYTELSEPEKQKCVNEIPALVDRGHGHPSACHYAEALKML